MSVCAQLFIVMCGRIPEEHDASLPRREIKMYDFALRRFGVEMHRRHLCFTESPTKFEFTIEMQKKRLTWIQEISVVWKVSSAASHADCLLLSASWALP